MTTKYQLLQYVINAAELTNFSELRDEYKAKQNALTLKEAAEPITDEWLDSLAD